MTDPSSKDQQQFEQVLNRLDALIKRSHSGVAELPPLPEIASLEIPAEPASAAPPPQAEAAQDVAETTEPPTTSGEPAPQEDAPSIPVLTRVYQGAAPPSEPGTAQIAPALLAVIDRAIHEELLQLQQSLSIRLQRELRAALQQAAISGQDAEPPQSD